MCQTGKALANGCPTKRQYQAKISALRKANILQKKKAKILERKNRILQAKLSMASRRKVTINSLEEYYSFTDKMLPDKIANFIKHQVQLYSHKNQGMRYSHDFKKFCLGIFFSGPKAYNMLRQTFVLPTPRCLQQSIKNLQITPGLHDFIFEYLRIKIRSFSSLAKYCNICMDSASIKSNLFYMINRDEVIGFEDYGSGFKACSPACNVAVIMIRGALEQWKQPIAYFLLNKSFDSEKAKNILLECISKLQTIGLTVLAMITDMGTDYRQMASRLRVTSECPYFLVNGNQIFYFFDPPHLVKACRNRVIENHVFFNEYLISFKCIEEVFNYDQRRPYRLVPRLTHAHIYPTNVQKMNVYLAVQFLSHTMASGLRTHVAVKNIPEEYQEYEVTATFVEFMDNLFDIFNSLTGIKEFNRPFSNSDNQRAFLLAAKSYLSKITIKNKFTNKDITNSVSVFKAWIHNINSLEQLWAYVRENYPEIQYLCMRRFNQDTLENYFGEIRKLSGNARNPTSIQIYYSFRKSFSLSFNDQINTGNCAPDMDNLISSFCDIGERNGIFEEGNPSLPINRINVKDYQQLDLLEKNSLVYTCGYYIKKCLQDHECEICLQYANANKPGNVKQSQYYCYFKAYESTNDNAFGSLYMPHDHFITYVEQMSTVFFKKIEGLIIKPLVIANLLQDLDNIEYVHPCPRFPYNYFRKLFARVTLFYALKFANKKFLTQSGRAKTIILNYN